MMARAKKKPVVKVTVKGRLVLKINGHVLVGIPDAAGGWSFTCPDWPELAGPVKPGDTYTRVVKEFTARCIWSASDVLALANQPAPKGRRR